MIRRRKGYVELLRGATGSSTFHVLRARVGNVSGGRTLACKYVSRKHATLRQQHAEVLVVRYTVDHSRC